MMRRLSILTLTIVSTIFLACQANPTEDMVKNSIEIPKESKQILKVTTPNWNSREGVLQRYLKQDNKWVAVGSPISIILGRNGLGWGVGLHIIPKEAKYIKREGDGRSPAGLFSLVNGFGYYPFKIEFPYRVYDRKYHCVDDSNSKWYNKIIDSSKVDKDYSSFEYMRLKNNLYKYGIVVNHNPNQIKDRGSCIFIHIWSGDKQGTAGCTAMSEENMIEVLKWLKKEKRPLLLQLPKDELKRIDL